jgi:2-isopropylmalate synthase
LTQLFAHRLLFYQDQEKSNRTYNLQIPISMDRMMPNAIATTRVVVTGDVSNNSKHALTGQSFNRSFRLYNPFISVFISFMCSAIRYLISVLVDFSGSGASMDVVVSSVRAYLSALNKMCSFAGAVKASSEVPQSTRVQSRE